MLFETGLPTRYYIDRTQIAMDGLIPSDTVTACPHKSTTTSSGPPVSTESSSPMWPWAYDFPTRQLLPIAGMVAFYNEKVDIYLDGELLERPETKFSSRRRVSTARSGS
jgi:uncharacterized protein (DUF427 family)